MLNKHKVKECIIKWINNSYILFLWLTALVHFFLNRQHARSLRFSAPLPTQSHYIEMATRKLWASKPACEDRLYNFLSNGLMRTLSWKCISLISMHEVRARELTHRDTHNLKGFIITHFTSIFRYPYNCLRAWKVHKRLKMLEADKDSWVLIIYLPLKPVTVLKILS